MNKKSTLIVFIISGLFLSALVSINGKLLLLAIPFLVYLIVGVMQVPGNVSLLANRTVDKTSAVAQEPVEIRIPIQNQGNTLVNLYIEDRLFPAMTILEEKPYRRVALSAGEVTELRYKFKATRGVYSWNILRACASDPFGLFEVECDIQAPGEILVRPTPLQIQPVTLKPRATLPSAGPILARKAGSGTDFWGVREYRPGDALRRINWNLAARHPNKLFSNDYEREESADFGLILDARRLTDDDALEEALFEYSVSAVATLAKNFLRNGNRVSLLVFGEAILTAFPGYGKHQLNMLLWNLAHARLGGDLPFTSLKHFPTKLFPTRSLLVIFSTVDPRDQEAYARLRAFGYEVLLISPDPVNFAAQRLPQTQTNTLASRAARVERVIQLKRLLKLGVKVIDWQVNQPLEPLVRNLAKQMMHTRNM
jgi:uncharacterized protein (DUF58 family)